MELFFRKPLYRYHFRELCRLLGWSPSKLRSKINILKRMGLVKEMKEKNMKIFIANTENENYRRYKIVYNLLNAYKIADYLEKNLEYFDVIILFGSAADGEDTETSDFDICIMGSKETPLNLETLEKKLGRKISLLFIENINMLQKRNPELLNNILNGFVIKGYLKVF